MSEFWRAGAGARTDAGYTGLDRRAALPVGELVSYRGPERRGTARRRGTSPRRRCAEIVLASSLPITAVIALGNLNWELAAAMLRDIAGGAFLLAGVGLLLGWRASGRTRSALLGISLLVGGALFTAIQPLGGLLHDDPLLIATAPGCLVITGLPALVLAARCTRMSPVNSQVRPARVAVATIGVAVGALALMVALRVGVGMLDQQLLWSLLLLAIGGGWCAVAAAIAIRARAQGQALVSPFTFGLQLFAARYLFAAIGVLGHPWALVASVGAACAAGTSSASFAACSLGDLLRQRGSSALRLAGELGATTRVLAHEQARREELVHDARSAVASLRLANGTLVRYRERLDVPRQAELQLAFAAELRRLAELLDATPSHTAEDFDLAQTLRPLVRLAQDGGAHVTLDIPPSVWVYGVRRDTATVVHTLLTNAARYARGSAVEVRAEARAFDVRLRVADHGPGVAAEEREAVFRRGFRGSSSRDADGSGLGLFVARRLMADQDGGLAVEEASGGGACFVVTIPASHANRMRCLTPAEVPTVERMRQRAAS